MAPVEPTPQTFTVALPEPLPSTHCSHTTSLHEKNKIKSKGPSSLCSREKGKLQRKVRRSRASCREGGKEGKKGERRKLTMKTNKL